MSVLCKKSVQCKKTVIAVLLTLVAGAAWSGGQTEESDFREVDGTETWEYAFDLSEYEPGTYNLLVRARDAAGNESLHGPINVVVDPESDRPQVSISNPVAGMRVGAVLTIIGTATDDDAIAAVEVQLDDRPAQTAEGTDFWSLNLDMSAVEDGPHRITAVSIDEGGVRSEPVTVAFNLDKRGPAVHLDSHQSGSFVNGRIRVSGRAEDPNGISLIQLGLDDMDSLEPVFEAGRRTSTETEFEMRIDTRGRADGPMILWVRAEDGTGSSTVAAYLLLVDNEPAELEILAPNEETARNGTVTFFGIVRDSIGVDSLRYETSHGPEGEIPMVPGDPYWSVPIDFSGAGRSGRATFIAVDATGNETEVRRTIPLDAEADEPLVTILWPRPGSVIGEAVRVIGEIRDDDGVAGVDVAVGREDAVRYEAGRLFGVDLDSLPLGPLRLTARGVDSTGVVGPEQSVDVVVAPAPPEVAFSELVIGGNPQDFSQGFAMYQDDSAAVTLRASASVTSARFSIGEIGSRAGVTTEENGVRLSIPIPRRLPPGRHVLTVEAADAYGGTAAAAAVFYVLQRIPETPEEGVTYFASIPETREADVVDPRLEDGTIRLSRFAPFSFYVGPSRITSVRLSPQSDDFAVSGENGTVTIRPLRSSVLGPVTVEVETASGRPYRVGPFTLAADSEAPQVTGVETIEFTAAARSVPAPFATETGARLEISMDAGGTFRPLSGNDISLASMDDGAVLLTLRATDAAGNARIVPTAVLKDATAPLIEFETPRDDDTVNGVITVGGRVIEDDLSALSLEGPDGPIASLPIASEFAATIDLVQLSDEVSVVALDRAGNRTEAAVPLRIDRTSDRPRVDIQLPLPDTVIREDVLVSGMVFDDDAVQVIHVRVNDGPWQELPGANSFQFPLRLRELGDNAHTVSVRAVDTGGTESEVVTRTFHASTEDPIAQLDTPAIDETNRGIILLEGRASDANGIAAVELSVDNGNSFQRATILEPVTAEGEAVAFDRSWQYAVDSSQFSDGLHSIQLRVVDGYGTAALYSTLIRVDNSPPDLALDSPGDGAVVAGSLPIAGRVTDGGTVEQVLLRISPLAEPGSAVYEESLPRHSVILHEVPVEQLAPGRYNVEIIASDAASNRASVSRNIDIADRLNSNDHVVIASPADGSTVAGPLTVIGYVRSAETVAGVVIRSEERLLGTSETDERGRFVFALPEGLAVDSTRITAAAELGDGRTIQSAPVRLDRRVIGPWVVVDSHLTGDFLTNRPFLRGRASYNQLVPKGVEPDSREYRDAVADQRIELVEVSLDNGRSFQEASGTDDWRFRVETGELSEERLEVVIRARAADGQVASIRRMYNLDGTPPSVALDSPNEGTRANESLLVTGRAVDENGTPEVAVILRTGDKSRYSVPAFIQGLYLDLNAIGATTYAVGAGLTFFDDNVKLQAQFGSAPEGRFYGSVLGAKLLANVASLPMSFLFGPDWDFLSLSVAVGANFSYFTMGDGLDLDRGLVLGGMVGQIEFPTFSFFRRTVLNKVSFYTEGQIWFISSDVQAGVNTRVSFGLRFGVL